MENYVGGPDPEETAIIYTQIPEYHHGGGRRAIPNEGIMEQSPDEDRIQNAALELECLERTSYTIGCIEPQDCPGYHVCTRRGMRNH